MANKKVSMPSDRLVHVDFMILESQKDFLNNLNESASAFIRKLIAAQMDGHEAEISNLKEEKRQHEAALHIIDAQIKELEAENNKQQNAITLREQLFKSQVDGLVEVLKVNGGFTSELDSPIKFRVKGMNAKLNGSGAQPFTVEELKQAVLEKAKAEGVLLRGR